MEGTLSQTFDIGPSCFFNEMYKFILQKNAKNYPFFDKMKRKP